MKWSAQKKKMKSVVEVKIENVQEGELRGTTLLSVIRGSKPRTVSEKVREEKNETGLGPVKISSQTPMTKNAPGFSSSPRNGGARTMKSL